MVRRLLRVVWLIPMLMLPAYAWGESLVATTDHEEIARDHTFLLSVRLNGSDADFSLDTAPLEKDFYVVPKGSGHQSGKWREERFQLGPKHAGVLRVPALSVTVHGKRLSSEPFTLTVQDAEGEIDDARLWIETHVNSHSVWQRQQLVYRFSVFSTDEMVSPRLSPPDFAGFRVETVQENRHEERIMNGRKVQVSNYEYLLFPQQAGDLKIAGPTMHATLLQTAKSRRFAAGQASFGDARHIPRPKVSRGTAIRLHVRPLPAAAQDLPVGRLEIESGVSESRGVAGEPLTWTVTMHGKGMLAVSLPDITRQMHITESFKTYPETPDIALKKHGDMALASGIWRVVVLPQMAGRMSLPSITVPYFNPVSGRVERVIAKSIDLSVAPPRQAQGNVVFRADASHGTEKAGVVRDISGWWKWLAVAFFMLWMATLAAWLLPVQRLLSLCRQWRVKQPGIRWVASAADSLDQFRRIKRFLGVSESLTPLGLLDLLPELEGSEAGRWLDAIEKSRYASGGLPHPLDMKPLRQMRDVASRAFGTADRVITPKDFGRIGQGARSAAGIGN